MIGVDHARVLLTLVSMGGNSEMSSNIALNPITGLSMLRIARGIGLLETEMLLSGEYQLPAKMIVDYRH